MDGWMEGRLDVCMYEGEDAWRWASKEADKVLDKLRKGHGLGEVMWDADKEGEVWRWKGGKDASDMQDWGEWEEVAVEYEQVNEVERGWQGLKEEAVTEIKRVQGIGRAGIDEMRRPLFLGIAIANADPPASS